MANSLDITNVASLQAYVQDHSEDLITRLFFGFESAMYCTPHEGVKGKKSLTSMVIGNLVKRYSATFQPLTNSHVFKQRNLEVFDCKVDMTIVPKDFEGTYLGMMRQKGQNSMDLPFEGAILQGSIDKIAQEQEIAFHQAVKTGSPADGDLLSVMFDGTKELIKDNIADLTPVATGALTVSNAFTKIEEVYAAVPKVYKKAGIECFISVNTAELARKQYRADYGKYVGNKDTNIDFGIPGVNFGILAGFPDDCILFTPKENIHYGYDAPADSRSFNFEQEDRKIKWWLDFKMGVNFGVIHPDVMVVNDRFTV